MDDQRPPKLWWGMWKRFIVAGLLIAVMSGAATATVALNTVSGIAQEIFPRLNEIHAPKGVVVPPYEGAAQTFLLIGSDKRVGSHGIDRTSPPRSDTLLLVHLDPSRGQTSVLSIPRDLLVHIETEDGRVIYPSKINAAYSIGSFMKGNDGGARLAASTVVKLLGIKLNGIIDVTFKGFIDVVDSLGCVYVNVDHRYFHMKEETESGNYASINLQPGYQKLCYENALSYVRYRHDDSDFVRVARQQDFIRNLREQISVGKLLSEIDKVSKAVGRAITTTFSSDPSQFIELTKLIVFSQRMPLRQVKFRFATDNTSIGGQTYVTATPQEIHETVDDFLYGHGEVHLAGHSSSSSPSPHAPQGSHHSHHPAHHSLSPAAIGLYPTPSSAHSEIFEMATRVPFPVVYPSLETGPAVPLGARSYTLRDTKGHRHHAFVEVFQQNGLGGYYDVEGMDWTNPPIISHPSQQETIGGRRYAMIDDGAHLHLIAWRQGGVLYWVNNTLLEDLTNAQMINIAQSAQPLR